MARCKDNSFSSIGGKRKRFFHTWKEWSRPFTATYRGLVTLIQTRECLYCKKVQVKAL